MASPSPAAQGGNSSFVPDPASRFVFRVPFTTSSTRTGLMCLPLLGGSLNSEDNSNSQVIHSQTLFSELAPDHRKPQANCFPEQHQTPIFRPLFVKTTHDPFSTPVPSGVRKQRVYSSPNKRQSHELTPQPITRTFSSSDFGTNSDLFEVSEPGAMGAQLSKGKNRAQQTTLSQSNGHLDSDSDGPGSLPSDRRAVSNPPSTNTEIHQFYANPITRRIRKQGCFQWFQSEGQTPITGPPDNGYGRKELHSGDVVVHKILGSVPPRAQVWCWENQRWRPIEVGYRRDISKKAYYFNFVGEDFSPCWISNATVQRRSPAKKRAGM